MWRGAARMLCCVLAVLAAAPVAASGSVFNGTKWPVKGAGTNGGMGKSIVDVCLLPGTTVQEDPGPGASDPNPSLDDVLRHISDALARTWEKHANVKFTGFDPCTEADQNNRDTVGLLISPNAGNQADVGYGAAGDWDREDPLHPPLRMIVPDIQFVPWGTSFNDCLYFDSSLAKNVYRYECVEDYAIHEFGHTLGFEHEWRNPDTPGIEDIPNCQDHEEPPLYLFSPTFDETNPGAQTVIINPNDFDTQSMMLYDDSPCADPNTVGTRFANKGVLSHYDIAGAREVYKPNVDIGVLQDDESRCPEAHRGYIEFDNDNVGDGQEGWVGASKSGGGYTRISFCRTDGRKFHPLDSSGPSGSRAYMTLKLGQECPNGARTVERYFDNDDANTAGPTLVGNPSPTTSISLLKSVDPFRRSVDTLMYFCLFDDPAATGAVPSLPDLGYAYGVFAASDFVSSGPRGTLWSDEDDFNNLNGFECAGCSSEQTAHARAIVEGTRDTAMHLVRVCCEAPVITHTVTGTKGANGWYTSDVSVAFDVSGATSTTGCDPVDVTQDTPADAPREIRCSATSTAGSTTDVVTIKRDATRPAIKFEGQSPTANAHGWNNADVRLRWSCTDTASGVDNVGSEIDKTVIGEGRDLPRSGLCADRAGNVRTDLRRVSIDRQAPDISFQGAAPAPNPNGWNRGDVTLTWSCADSLSGTDATAGAGTRVLTGEGAALSATGLCVDKAGNSTADTRGGVGIDRTPPSIEIARQSPPPNASGWNNTDVTLDWACADSLAGVDPAASTTSRVLDGEGADLSGQAECVDRAGNSAVDTHSGVRIDRTPPSITVTHPSEAATYSLGASVPAGYACDDLLSGPATCAGTVPPGQPIDTATVGAKRFSVDSSDLAGNVASENVGYDVHWPFTGFRSPIVDPPHLNRATAASTIVLGWRLEGVTDADILVLGSPTSQRIDCTTQVPIPSTVAPAAGKLSLGPAPGDYQYNWKTQPAYAGSCRAFELALLDGSVHQVLVRFASK